MKGFLKGYYGYKNFGDELLLLGTLRYLFSHYSLDHLFIETDDVAWLEERLRRHADILGDTLESIQCIQKHTASYHSRDILFLGGGEVVTDGRPFPYNGWNYVFGYRKTFLFGRYVLIGGIGTPKRRSSRVLLALLLRGAEAIIVRESRSYDVASLYTDYKKITLYHDFAEDVLPGVIGSVQKQKVGKKKKKTITPPTQALININPYIRSQETKYRLVEFARRYDRVVYFPAQIGVDDRCVDELRQELPDLIVYDRTKYDLRTICTDLLAIDAVMAARLHVLWIAKLLNIPFEAIVYQEKIATFLDMHHTEG